MIGYYAHQQGSGHCNYAQIFSDEFQRDLHIFSSYPFKFSEGSNIVFLENEDPDGTSKKGNQSSPPDYLHYSPVGQKSIQQRSLKLLSHLVEASCDLLIVDVSAEIAALSRAASIPYAYVKLPGNRNDPGHLQAFQGAAFLLAYYPQEFEHPEVPDWVKKKTIYLDFISRIKVTAENKINQEHFIQKIVIMSGNGGNAELERAIEKVALRFPKAQIQLLGKFAVNSRIPNVHSLGFVNNVQDYLQKADLIIANCGLNTISEIIHLNKPYLAIPEARPFSEQDEMCKILARLGYAINLKDLSILSDKEILNTRNFARVGHTNQKLKDFKSLLNKNFHNLVQLPSLFREVQENKAVHEFSV
ncbi:glycosyltransferase [Gramella sp. AN32]|uniref:Glycosyltransferase n=1 Tax=Christiangramia antarctica TaxID=2058158 RepID=A0ABW5WZZ5_9FLAO|nr:glycosyltransferase [Gramella sp. AN32]MCM4154965.1 hypothetical protein [Gramella sp. AN32]